MLHQTLLWLTSGLNELNIGDITCTIFLQRRIDDAASTVDQLFFRLWHLSGLNLMERACRLLNKAFLGDVRAAINTFLSFIMIRTLVRRTTTTSLDLLFRVVRVEETVLGRATRRHICNNLAIIALVPPLMLFVFLLYAFQSYARPFLHILPLLLFCTFRQRPVVLNFVKNVCIQTMIFLCTLWEWVPIARMLDQVVNFVLLRLGKRAII